MWSNRKPARALRVLLASGAAALLAGCSPDNVTFLSPGGPIASAQRGYFIDIILILLIVVVPVLLLTPLFAWRYRYRNSSAPYRPDWSFSWPLEIIIWGVPFCVVIVLAVWLWRATHDLDPYRPLVSGQPPLRVDVVGYDWKWLFIYPSLGVASLGQFAFPSDRPVSIRLTSDTVMQSFFIPALGSQIYAMAGMVTRLHLKADRPGDFRGENTQYNGKKFHRQKFTATAMTPDAFGAWARRIKTEGIPLTAATYKILRKQNTAKDMHGALHADRMPEGVVYFRDVPKSLFANVVKSFHGGSSASAALANAAAEGRSTSAVAAKTTDDRAKED